MSTSAVIACAVFLLDVREDAHAVRSDRPPVSKQLSRARRTCAEPRVLSSAAQSLESARPRRGQGDALFNDPGGEYLAMVALRDGSIGVVTPIQNRAAQRLGFTWWRFE